MCSLITFTSCKYGFDHFNSHQVNHALYLSPSFSLVVKFCQISSLSETFATVGKNQPDSLCPVLQFPTKSKSPLTQNSTLERLNRSKQILKFQIKNVPSIFSLTRVIFITLTLANLKTSLKITLPFTTWSSARRHESDQFFYVHWLMDTANNRTFTNNWVLPQGEWDGGEENLYHNSGYFILIQLCQKRTSVNSLHRFWQSFARLHVFKQSVSHLAIDSLAKIHGCP